MTMHTAYAANKTRQGENNQQVTRPLRWFLLAWESLVYLWALLYIYGVNPITLEQMQKTTRSLPFQGVYPVEQVVATFTALMLALGGLLWMGLSGKLPRYLIWLYFFIQGALVFLIGLIMQQDNVVLNLYLALILSSIAMLRQARYVLVVAIGYVVLFLFSSRNLSQIFWAGQNVYFNVLWAKTDYAAMLLLVVGFIVVYWQQVRVHNQLARAHEQLQTSAELIEELTLATERQRLARELHDTLVQGVAGLIMQLEAADGAEAVELADQLQPDVILMDLRMPGMDGLDAIAQIRKHQPDLAVLILTTYNEDDLMIHGLQAGACGYLLKDCTLETLLQALRAAARGEMLVQPEVMARILTHAARGISAPGQLPPLQARGSLDLTERERAVLESVARGERSKEIARHLGISERTVGSYLNNIFSKLGVDSRASAVAVAIERGLLSHERAKE